MTRKLASPPTAVIFILCCLPVAAPAQIVEAPEQGAAAGHSEHDHQRTVGFLGVSVRPLNADLRRHFGAPTERGVLVATVDAGTPAEAAGLAVGDVIVAIDDRPVGTVSGLHRAIRERAGERVAVALYRDGDEMTLAATLGSRPADRPSRDRYRDHAEHWEEWGENWAEWGERWGEGWAEWGEEFGERWAELGEEMGERWGERGHEWGTVGAEIGARMAEAFAQMDWDEVERALEQSMRALDEIDWDEIGDEIERALEEVDEALEETVEELDDKDR